MTMDFPAFGFFLKSYSDHALFIFYYLHTVFKENNFALVLVAYMTFPMQIWSVLQCGHNSNYSANTFQKYRRKVPLSDSFC